MPKNSLPSLINRLLKESYLCRHPSAFRKYLVDFSVQPPKKFYMSCDLKVILLIVIRSYPCTPCARIQRCPTLGGGCPALNLPSLIQMILNGKQRQNCSYLKAFYVPELMIYGRYNKYRSISDGNPFNRSNSSPLLDTPEWSIYSTFGDQHACYDEPESNRHNGLSLPAPMMTSGHCIPKTHASMSSNNSHFSSLHDLDSYHQRSSLEPDRPHQESQAHIHRNGSLTKSLSETGWSKTHPQSLSHKRSIRRRPLPASSCMRPSEDSATRSHICLLYTSPSPRDRTRSRMPSSA